MAVGPIPAQNAKAQAVDISELNKAAAPNGRLETTPAYYQTDSDEAVQLDAADSNPTRLAVAIVPPVDMAISSIARFITAVVMEPVSYLPSIAIYDNGSAPEPNGDLNGSETPGSPTNMTSNTEPSPYVISNVEKDGDNQQTYYDAYKLFDGDEDTHALLSARKSIDNAAAVDKGGSPNKVGIPVTGHGLVAGQYISITGTTNYDGAYTVDATSSTDEVVIESAYVAETFSGSEGMYVAPSSDEPVYLSLDLGSGNAKMFNVLKYQVRDTREPKAIAIHGSNEDSPTIHTDGDWTELADLTSLTEPNSDKTWLREPFTNGTAYRHYRLKITDMYEVTGEYGAVCWLKAVEFIEAQDEDAPGTLLTTLISEASVGDTADVWKVDSVDEEYTLLAGQKYWIVEGYLAY